MLKLFISLRLVISISSERA